MNRKEARKQAFYLIFENQFKKDEAHEVLEIAVEVRDLEDDEYVKSVYMGVCEHLSELDELIKQNSTGWAISRISKVGLAAMRLCIFEMLYRDDIPVSVSINEAVELIKTYATESDASFANGILGTVSKTLPTANN